MVAFLIVALRGWANAVTEKQNILGVIAYDYDEPAIRQHDVLWWQRAFCRRALRELPTSVPDEWRDYFDRLAQMPGYVAHDVAHAPVIAAFAELGKDGGFRPVAVAPASDNKKQSAVGQLITAYRSLGTRWADLDPLKRLPRPKIDELDLTFYGFTGVSTSVH